MAKKFDLVGALKLHGFVVNDYHGAGGAVILRRPLVSEIDEMVGIEKVYIYESAGVCAVDYMGLDGQVHTTRWYKTIGKRTCNALVKADRLAG